MDANATDKNAHDKIVKSPWFYVAVLTLWISLIIPIWFNFARNFAYMRVFTIIGIVISGICISYFWLNGIKDILNTAWSFVRRKHLAKMFERIKNTDVENVNDRVLLLYCTYNDFDADALLKSMQQNYHNFETIILDDSTKTTYKEQINAFASQHGVAVVRRNDHEGHKAGNINNYLQKVRKTRWDYIVLLDSDEIIPNGFIKEALRYFYALKNIGLVQANHIGTRNNNLFNNLFHISTNAYWSTHLLMRHKYGFSSFYGHGAMIKRECYESAGGFPQMVVEDVCFSILARDKGYFTAFAPNIFCGEKTPCDYLSFRKYYSKWSQGDLEFIGKFSGRTLRAGMKWYEKLDVMLFAYQVPMSAILIFTLLMINIFMPLTGIDMLRVYPAWMLAPSVLFFLSPIFPDLFAWTGRINIFRYIIYVLCVPALFCSMLYTTLKCALFAVFGKRAKFVITPKQSDRMTLFRAFCAFLQEIIFVAIIIVISYFTGAPWATFVLAYAMIVSFLLMFLSNRRYSDEKTRRIDAKTKKATLRINKIFLDGNKAIVD